MSDYVGLEPGGHVLLEDATGLLLEVQSGPGVVIGGRHVLLDCGLTINGVDLSNRVEAVTVEVTTSLYDLTTIGQLGHVWASGPRSDTITVSWWQDFTAGSVDETLSSLFGSSGFPVVVDTLTGPVYTGSCIAPDYQPAQGKVGDGLLVTTKMPVVGELSVSGTG